MTSTVCHRFVQNAWKKERCSNCFKSKEEHVSLKREAPVNKRPLTTTVAAAKSRGIIKNTISAPARRKRTVSFKPELTEIIGFGGEDWSEAEEEDTVEERSSESSDDDPSDLSEDDKDLDKLTKSNTEQNANITATTTSDRRRTFTQLMLGQPQKDQDGKKQTLLVSVTPFGQNQDESERTPPKRASKTVSHIPIAKNKEILVEARPKVVLTSYLKNRESPEPTKTDKFDKLDINNKKDNEVLPVIKEKQCDDKNKDKSAAAEEGKQVASFNAKNETKQTVISDKLVTKPEVNSELSSEDISDRIYDDVADEDETTEIVETINETSVLKKVEVVSVSAKETSLPVLETPLNEQIVKSELKVQLSTTPLKHLEKTQSPNLPLSLSNNQSSSQDSSSEESADSLGPAESREQAGEPDGRADPDVPCEPPALPRSPPPMITPPPRSSFLHGAGTNGKTSTTTTTTTIIDSNKPKIPSKPDKVAQMVRKPSLELSPLPMSPNDQNKLSNKRRAPNPPPTTLEDAIESTEPQQPQEITPLSTNIETTPLALENRIYSNINPPEEKIEIQPTTPEITAPLTPIIQNNTPVITNTTPSSLNGPEPAPRKNISMSSDNLLYVEKSEEKRKDKTKTRFSLMKFLRVGGNGGKSSEKTKIEDLKEKHLPFPKPRLVIVHPLDLNGTIEVVSNGEEQKPNEGGALPPAPPPRNLPQKCDDLKPPPKSDDIIRKHRQLPLTPQKCTSPQPVAANDNVYANLGEVRSGLAPSKPQRTASMREREAQEQQLQQRRKHSDLSPQEHVYERVAPPRRHSDESNNNVSSSSNKVTNLNLNTNLKNGNYAGSESDLEIYSPCGSYYGAECEISDRGCSRPCQLRSRKGRSIVHKNLEDNYGAVVVANHEALAQVLEHLHLSPTIPPSLRGLQSASMLHWSDFSIVDSTPSIIVGRRNFYHALWGAHHVTLSVSKDQASLHKHPVGLGAFCLNPVTEFSDLVDGKYFTNNCNDGNKELIQACITVFPWMQIDTVQSLGATLKSKPTQNIELNRDACFILLQFVNSLKTLQAQGIEEIPLSLSNFILSHDIDKDTHHRLCLMQGFAEEARCEQLGSLCQCAQVALDELFTNTKLAHLIKTLLKKESATSLSQVKAILEFSLWGPSDVAQGVPIKERELALQRWLDLERATVLHGLVGTRLQLSVLEEYHLLFLVRSSAKIMCEASTLLETNGVLN